MGITTIEQRLKALECNAAGNLSPIILIVEDDITPEEQQQIDEAESQGRKVLLL